jgi:hypothetical protein
MSMPRDILEKKIAKLEAEAAYQMALETFLDCCDAEVKVIKMAKPRPSEMTWSGIRMRGSIFNTGRPGARAAVRGVIQTVEGENA